jgi:hypothetical protein
LADHVRSPVRPINRGCRSTRGQRYGPKRRKCEISPSHSQIVPGFRRYSLTTPGRRSLRTGDTKPEHCITVLFLARGGEWD